MSAAKWAIGPLLPFAIWPDAMLQLPQSGHFSIAQHFLGADICCAGLFGPSHFAYIEDEPRIRKYSEMCQTNSDSWLTDVTILNESAQFSEAGDVTVYRNIADMCEYIEPWFGEQKLGYALTGNGLPITLTTDGKSVFGEVLDDGEPDTAVLTGWLMSLAASVRDARLYKAKKRRLFAFGSTNAGSVELDGQLPRSIEGLLAYVSIK